MNMFVWVLQILMALHTAIGAFWKFSNPEQTVPSLALIPHSVWLGLIAYEMFCSVGLILPIFNRSLSKFAPIAAAGIALEMLLFCGVHVYSGDENFSPLIYWLIVTALCLIIVFYKRRRIN
jgi:DoxX-like family